MASKVNVKFVVMLGAALALVLAGMALVFFFVLKKSGEDWAARGDEAMAAQNWEDADAAYSFAVAHDRSNVEWLTKWRDAMRRRVIDNRIDFEARFSRDYVGTMRQIAQMTRTANVGAHSDYLEMQMDRMTGSTSPDTWRFLLSEARASLGFFEDPTTPPTPGQDEPQEWHRLYKYSGVALGVLFALNQTDSQEEVDLAERHLRLALAAAPDDAEVALELSQLYATLGERRRTQPPIDLAAAERLQDQSRRVLADALVRDPSDVSAAIGLLQIDLNRLRRDTMARLGNAVPTPAQIQQVVEPLRPRLDGIHALMMDRARAGTLDRLTIVRFRGLEQVIASGDAGRRGAEVIEAALAHRPDDVHLLALQAEALNAQGLRAEAVATLERLIALPNKPLGTEGFLLWQVRPMARQMQAEFTLSSIGSDATEAQRQELLATATRYRDELAKVVAADDPSLLKIDAQMAFVRRDWANAERLLLRLNERSGGADRDGLWWMAQTAMALNKPGVAQSALNVLNERQPDSIGVLTALAAVEFQLRNRERAEGLTRRLQEIAPDEPSVRQLADQVFGNNPVRLALDEYDAIATGRGGSLPDPVAALAALERSFDANNHDPSLGMILMQRYMERRDVQAALGVCDRVLQSTPGEPNFQRFRGALAQGDLTAALIDLINSGPARDVDKALARRLLYIDAGDQASAARELASAAAMGPNELAVLEAQFVDAVAREDAAEIRRVVERARQSNADSQGGDTFKFREQMYLGQGREAITTLEALVTRAPNDGALWRFLGLQRAQIGRFDDAVAALRRALQIRPNDVGTAMDLIDLLSRIGRNPDALLVARDSERFGRANVDFLRRLWFLEAEVGNRGVARAGHEALRTREPELLWNNAMLADLYMDSGELDKARVLITEMRAREDNLGLVGLDARWHADRGDLNGARQAYIDYVAKLPPEANKVDAFLAMSDFMRSREQMTLAAAALEAGRLYQTPTVMECDRALGDILTMVQRLEEAIAAYRRVVDANADDSEGTYRKRMAENLIRLERFDEADRELAQIARQGAQDRSLLLLRAELSKNRGRRDEALRLLDEAVRLNPDDPIVFFQRAELLQEDETRLQDALADYDSAIRKSPSFWQALRNRSGVYRRLGRMPEAVADLRSATLAAGTDGDAVSQLLNELMNLGRSQEAITAADAALAARSTDTLFMQRLGAIFMARQEFTAAAKYYKAAFDIRQDIDVAQRYLDCLLNQRPPQLRLAEDVINAMGSQVTESAGLLAASVAIHTRRARLAEAHRDATLAFDRVSTDAPRLIVWHRTMMRAFEDRSAYISYLRNLAAAKQATALRDWPLLFLAMTQVGDPAQRQAGIEQLHRLSASGQPDAVKLAALQTLGATLYELQDYSQAADLWRAALERFPDDWELNNNLAYTLTEHLGRAQEALPYALRAVQAQPGSPSVNDTVGWAYFKSGDLERGIQYLWRAARLSREAGEQAAIVDHIVEVEIARGEKVTADRWLNYFRRLIRESPWMNQTVLDARVQELQDKINSLP